LSVTEKGARKPHKHGSISAPGQVLKSAVSAFCDP
jgi:hypothetical protein